MGLPLDQKHPMLDLWIKVAELPADLPQIHQIRYHVFQLEQGVAPELEFDGQDEHARHLLAYLGDRPVGTARLRSLKTQTVKVERVAVLSEARGLGIGKKIMQTIIQQLTEASVLEICIHAQVPVIGFYEQLGFEREGEIFEEASIPHVNMKKLLREPK